MLLPLAKRLADCALVSIDEVDRGLDCGCVCPFCEERVVARKGDVRDHYFAHAARAVNDDKECPASFVRCLFWMARRVVEESTAIWLPAMDVRLIDGSVANVREAGDVAYSAVTFPHSKAEQSATFSEASSDIALLTVEGYTIALVFRFLVPPLGGFEHIYVVDGEQVATVMIGLTDVKARFEEKAGRFRQDVEDAVLRGSASMKQWLYHPRAERLKRKALEARPASRPVTAPPQRDPNEWVKVIRGTNAKTGKPIYSWHRKSEWK